MIWTALKMVVLGILAVVCLALIMLVALLVLGGLTFRRGKSFDWPKLPRLD